MRLLTLPAAWTQSRLFSVIRWCIYALVAGIVGWQLGRMLASPSRDLVAPLIFMGTCILITLNRPLEGLLLALVLHPFINFFYLNIDLGAGIPSISLLRVTVAIVFTLILARVATGQYGSLRLTWTDVFMLLTTLGLGIAAIRGTTVTTYLQWLFDKFMTPYMIYYITKRLIINRAALHRTLWATMLIGAYCGIYGIYTQTTGNILFEEGELTGPLWYNEQLRIMRGLLDSPHVFGLVFSLAIPIDFYLLIKASTPGKKLLLGLALAVTMGGLFFTYKRTAWVATMVSFLIIMLFFPRFRRLFLVLLVLSSVVIALYSDQISDSAVVSQRLGEKANTLNGRLELWRAAWQEWRKAPYFGYGFGGFFARTSLKAIESHYLWLLVDGGLAGFVPYVVIFLLVFRNSVRLFRSRAPAVFVEPDLVAIFWGLFAAYLLSLSTVIMNHELPHTLFFLLAGAMVGSQEVALAQETSEFLSQRDGVCVVPTGSGREGQGVL